jgi:sigma-54 dependent transcriptional regulator, acetoin dehydrogenase operon transcriptional activator AcoR
MGATLYLAYVQYQADGRHCEVPLTTALEPTLGGFKIETAGRHASRVSELMSASQVGISKYYPLESWRRCLDDFHLNPAAKVKSVPYVGAGQLNIARDALGEDLSIASDVLMDLFAAVRGTGYSAGLANHDGLFLLEQAERHRDSYVATDQPGWQWPEKIGGTNSVGTCIIDRKVTSVFGRQHFFFESTDTACAGAPVFDALGSLWGVLSITTRNPQLDLQTHALATNVVAQSAMTLSAQIFRRSFAGSTVIEWRSDDGQACLIAIDPDQRIEGANSAARNALKIDDAESSSKLLRSIFEKNAELRRAKVEGGAIVLQRKRDGAILHANVRPATRPTINRSIRPKSAAQTGVVAGSPSISIEECAGNDPSMLSNIGMLRRVRDSGLPILLLGETGTGKDTLARAIHADSDRAGQPFVAFNCAAVPESLIDSELFGYVAGSFTGASTGGNRGRILEASGGTLFLDEIGDMPLVLQTRLLRVLETREVVALGSGVAQKIDVTVVAATNQHLEDRIAQGLFREDLYYRLAGAVIYIPALRERVDLEQIIETILGRTSSTHKLDPAAFAALMDHRWPGNIRELTHVLRRAVSIAQDEWITVEDLMLRPGLPSRQLLASPAKAPSGHQSVYQAEAAAVRSALDNADWDVAAAAALFGVSRATFYRKMQQHQIRRAAPSLRR